MSGMSYLKHYVLMWGKKLRFGYNKDNQLTVLKALYDYFYY